MFAVVKGGEGNGWKRHDEFLAIVEIVEGKFL